MKVLVAQLGARRHYAVPAALAKADLLDRFVTDYYSSTDLQWIPKSFGFSVIAKAKARTSSDVPAERVSHFPLFAALAKLDAAVRRHPKHQSQRWIRSGRRFASLSRRYVSPATTHIYAFTSAARELFELGKERGVVCILDHATAPRMNEMRLVAEEHERFPNWAPPLAEDPFLAEYHARQLQEAALADIVICNSTFAKRTLVLEGVDPTNLVVVPLGLKLAPPRPPTPSDPHRQGLRVLYVGADGLRKGVPYLVQALTALSSKHIEARFVGALGFTPIGDRQVQLTGAVFGDVPRAQMAQHFDWADVLVLPSVSDTFGLVMLEAMAHGLPVIASENTGGPDILRDGADGFVVKIRDSDAIAARLDLLASAPKTLAQMRANALERVQAYSLEAYRDRLIDAIARTQWERRLGHAITS